MLGLENPHGSGSDVHNCQRALAGETGHEATVAFFSPSGEKKPATIIKHVFMAIVAPGSLVSALNLRTVPLMRYFCSVFMDV